MILANTKLETERGAFSVSLHEGESGARCLSIYKGDLGSPGTAVRLHSSCLFGEALCGLDCDCRAQLDAAMRKIDELGRGAVVYLNQEGRGAGLLNKIRGLEMQRINGVNSYAAYAALGLPRDMRDYTIAGTALADLNVSKQISLMSNSPEKHAALEKMGFTVVTRLRLSYRVNRFAEPELRMKHREGGYEVDFSRITFSD